MRQVTATEKYRAVNEGKMAKREFVRQMRQSFPQFISQYNGFDDTVQILKNRGMIFEQIKPAFSEAKVYDDRPALTYSLDALDRGIRAELAVLGIDPADAFNIKADDYKKAENKAKDNLEKDANHYLNLMAGESNKVDKHDREKEVKRGALDKDTFNDMKKATLKEEVEVQAEELEMSEDAKKNLLGKVVGALRAKYPEITAGVVKDFIKTHYQDLLDGADIESEFEEYIYANYETASDFREAKGTNHDGEILAYIADTYIQNAKDGDRAYAAFRDLHIRDAVQDVVGILQDPKHPLHGETKKEYQIVSRDKARGLFEKKVNEDTDDEHMVHELIGDLFAPGNARYHLDMPVEKIAKALQDYQDGLTPQGVKDAMDLYDKLAADGTLDKEVEDGDGFISSEHVPKLKKAFELIGLYGSGIAEKKGKDHDGDGDIDGDDYMAAKDKAIKKAMGKKVNESSDYVSFAMQHIGDESTPVTLTHGFNRYDEKKYKTTLGKALAFIGKNADASAIENGDVMVDGGQGEVRITIGDQEFDIKGAMGKEEQLKEAIKSIIKKTLNEDVINEAATAKLADWGAGYENFEGVKSVVNDLENVVTEVEAFYDKIGDKIAKIFERTAEFKNEEGLNIGAFIAPSLETAFFQDLKPVTKKGFLHKIELPKVKTISQADVQAARKRGEIDETPADPKETIFTPNF